MKGLFANVNITKKSILYFRFPNTCEELRRIPKMPYENKESGKREQIPEDEVTCRRGINKRRGASE